MGRTPFAMMFLAKWPPDVCPSVLSVLDQWLPSVVGFLLDFHIHMQANPSVCALFTCVVPNRRMHVCKVRAVTP